MATYQAEPHAAHTEPFMYRHSNVTASVRKLAQAMSPYFYQCSIVRNSVAFLEQRRLLKVQLRMALIRFS